MAESWDETTQLPIGLIGCGSIGTIIAEAIDRGTIADVELVAVFDIVREKAEKLVGILSGKPTIAETANDLIESKDLKLIVEAASQDAVKQYALKALEEGKDLMIMSAGALIDENLFGQISDYSKMKGRKVYVPSGAIVGLDNIKSAAVGKIFEVTLTTRKPPLSFQGAPFVRSEKINLDSIKEPLLLYEGPAREAVKLFPNNVNVAASLSLAGVGPDETKVRIITDPGAKEIIHEIRVKGEFGELETRTVNRPFPNNPKTSYIAALSAIATLKKIAGNIVIGT